MTNNLIKCTRRLASLTNKDGTEPALYTPQVNSDVCCKSTTGMSFSEVQCRHSYRYGERRTSNTCGLELLCVVINSEIKIRTKLICIALFNNGR